MEPLSKEELKEGIIITKCPKCGDSTRHKLANLNYSIPARVRGKTSFQMPNIPKKPRQCLKCGTIHWF